jgi:hypothetical protein
LAIMPSRRRIGVFPAAALAERRHLFDILARAYPVSFEARQLGETADLAAAICIGAEFDEVKALAAAGIRCLAYPSKRDESSPADSAVSRPPTNAAESLNIHLTEAPTLHPTMRGRTLKESSALEPHPLAPNGHALSSPICDEDTSLATVDGRPVWALRHTPAAAIELATSAPAELPANDCLRNHLLDGRCLRLLPLVHFIRSVAADIAWQLPEPRACFLIDDPNLRSPRYGFVDYLRLAVSARRHGYHIAFATVPLDASQAHPAAVRLFHEHADRLSLIMHGNNHTRCEFEQLATMELALPALAQALRRVQRLESRTGLAIARIMAVPHGACSEVALAAMRRLGHTAACISRPYPWLAAPPPESPLAGWRPAEFVCGGLPILPRCRLSTSEGELALRAFLGLPLILYGHHADLSPDGERLAEIAARLGNVRWMSPQSISRTNYATRQAASSLHLLLFAREATIDVDDSIARLAIEVPVAQQQGDEIHVMVDDVRIALARSEEGLRGEAVLNWERRQSRVERQCHVRIEEEAPIDPASIPPPPWRAWPVIRRRLTELRDRSLPARSRLAGPRAR